MASTILHAEATIELETVARLRALKKDVQDLVFDAKTQECFAVVNQVGGLLLPSPIVVAIPASSLLVLAGHLLLKSQGKIAAAAQPSGPLTHT